MKIYKIVCLLAISLHLQAASAGSSDDDLSLYLQEGGPLQSLSGHDDCLVDRCDDVDIDNVFLQHASRLLELTIRDVQRTDLNFARRYDEYISREGILDYLLHLKRLPQFSMQRLMYDRDLFGSTCKLCPSIIGQRQIVDYLAKNIPSQDVRVKVLKLYCARYWVKSTLHDGMQHMLYNWHELGKEFNL